MLAAAIGVADVASAQPSPDALTAARAATAYLASEMDHFHDRFWVYEDVSSAGNHFHALGKLPDGNALVTVNGSYTDDPYDGATAIQCTFTSTGANFGGFYFMNGLLPNGATAPILNFGTTPDAGIDLTGAERLTFWARGERGGERVEFFMGGVGRDPGTGAPLPNTPAPDSTPRISTVPRVTTLSTAWTKVTIDLSGAPLGYVLGGFGWVASAAENPTGATFYLDDIAYELGPSALAARLDQPRFIRSFRTLPQQSAPPPVGQFDLVLRNVAYTYDNAVAVLAFLAEGSPDSLRRARLIGDAFVYASLHDRTYDDGRLRDANAAGDIALPPGWTPNGRAGTSPVPGFYADVGQTFYEIEDDGLSTGNDAWAGLALMALHRTTGDPAYLEAARRLGAFLRTFRASTGTYQGFRGGLDHPEAGAVARPWASSEHNLDLHAFFTGLAALTGDASWSDEAAHAATFVDAMWDTSRGCYLAGTLDPEHRNDNANQLPVDVQAWVTLAIPAVVARRDQILACAEAHHRTTDAGFDGFDFNDDRDGVWFEGTAQMAVARAFQGDAAGAETLRVTLRTAAATPPFGADGGLVAATRDGLTTGFDTAGGTPFEYFRRLHVGATAWHVLAQLEYNPFYGLARSPSCDDGDACTIDVPTAGTGCVHTPRPLDTVDAFTCRFDNAQAALDAVDAACASHRCVTRMAKRIERARTSLSRALAGRATCPRRVARVGTLCGKTAAMLQRLIDAGRLPDANDAARARAELQQVAGDLASAGPALCPSAAHGLQQTAPTQAFRDRPCGARIGSTQPALARLEAGGVTPSLNTLDRIAEALGLELVVDLRPGRHSA